MTGPNVHYHPDTGNLACVEWHGAASVRARSEVWPAGYGPGMSSDPLPAGVFDGPEPCPECGHDTSTTPTHNVRPCAECDDAAQLGQYAPCQTVSG